MTHTISAEIRLGRDVKSRKSCFHAPHAYSSSMQWTVFPHRRHDSGGVATSIHRKILREMIGKAKISLKSGPEMIWFHHIWLIPPKVSTLGCGAPLGGLLLFEGRR